MKVMERALIGSGAAALTAILTMTTQLATADYGVTLFLIGVLGALVGALTAIAKE